MDNRWRPSWKGILPAAVVAVFAGAWLRGDEVIGVARAVPGDVAPEPPIEASLLPPAERQAVRESLRDIVNWVGDQAGWQSANDDRIRRQFTRDVERYTREVGKLSDADAARRWLRLFDRQAELPPEPDHLLDALLPPSEEQRQERPIFSSDEPLSSDPTLDRLYRALPPPDVWHELYRQVAARPARNAGKPREAALRLLAAGLAGTTGEQQQKVRAICKRFAGRSGEAFPIETREILLRIAQCAPELIDPDWFEDNFERSLKVLQGEDAPTLIDLYGVLGTERAEAAYVKAFAARLLLRPPETAAIKQRLSRLAARHVGQMQLPQWELVDGDGQALFDALTKRFPPDVEPGLLMRLFSVKPWNEGEVAVARRRAAVRLMDSAVRQTDSRRAIALAREVRRPPRKIDENFYFDQSAWYGVAYGGPARSFDTVLAVLRDDPELPLIATLVNAAKNNGRGPELVAYLREMEKKAGPQEIDRHLARGWMIAPLLQMGRVDEAIAAFRKTFDDPPPANLNSSDLRVIFPSGFPDWQGNWLSPDDYSKRTRAHLLVQIGHALSRPDVMEDGIALLKAAMPDAIVDHSGDLLSGSRLLASAYAMAGDDQKAIDVFAKAYDKHVKWRQGVPLQAREYDAEATHFVMAYFIRLSEAGRHQEALDLLARHAHWPTGDALDPLYRTILGDAMLHQFSPALAASLLETRQFRAAARVAVVGLTDDDGAEQSVRAFRACLAADAQTTEAALKAYGKSSATAHVARLIAEAEVDRQKRDLTHAVRRARLAVSGASAMTRGQETGIGVAAYETLAAVLNDQGDAAGAQVAARKAAANRYIRQGYEHLRLHLAHSAIDAFRRAVELAPDEPEHLAALAAAHYAAFAPDDARVALQEAIRLAAGHPSSQLFWTWEMLGDFAPFEAILDEGLKTVEKDGADRVGVVSMRLALQLYRDETDAAVKSFRRLVEAIVPSSAASVRDVYRACSVLHPLLAHKDRLAVDDLMNWHSGVNPWQMRPHGESVAAASIWRWAEANQVAPLAGPVYPVPCKSPITAAELGLLQSESQARTPAEQVMQSPLLSLARALLDGIGDEAEPDGPALERD